MWNNYLLPQKMIKFLKGFNSFNENKETYCEVRLLVSDKREVLIWSTDCENTKNLLIIYNWDGYVWNKRYRNVGNIFVGKVKDINNIDRFF